ncbi:hypothetical protein Q9L42_005985 [Methylomarinum sp. Ch1-1]|uniref:Uncharacterized protein n=1 Tax=Methylomarinum roseum TaxID=3067653 RepID=A0AAU7NXF6_9GAMM|nr:hypothetical protein [Methylomarinum sp. Ch1-1]MDP4522236.1 hypothetical protein [Methylomarinum sp. Ch1-1]
MSQNHLVSRFKYIIIFLLLMLIDVSPIPVTALIGLYVVLFRPRWFMQMIDNIY